MSWHACVLLVSFFCYLHETDQVSPDLVLSTMEQLHHCAAAAAAAAS